MNQQEARVCSREARRTRRGGKFKGLCMKTERTLSVITCLFVVYGLVLETMPLRAAEDNGQLLSLTKDQEERIRKWKEADRLKYEKLEPVTIYGRVIDQDGNPVADAEVCISWEKATLLLGKSDFGRKDWIKTDKDGLFHFTCAKLFDASAKAKKEGYESSLGGVVVYG